MYNYFFKSSSSFDEIRDQGEHLKLGVTQNGGYTLTYNGVKSKQNESFPLKQVALLLGYLDPEDRISLEKLIGKGGRITPRPLVSNFQGYI